MQPAGNASNGGGLPAGASGRSGASHEDRNPTPQRQPKRQRGTLAQHAASGRKHGDGGGGGDDVPGTGGKVAGLLTGGAVNSSRTPSSSSGRSGGRVHATSAARDHLPASGGDGAGELGHAEGGAIAGADDGDGNGKGESAGHALV